MSYYYCCRCCLIENTNFYKIHQEIAEKLMSIANISVLNDDGLPDIICDECVIQINQSYEFRQKCEYSDSMLRKWTYHYNDNRNNYNNSNFYLQQQQQQQQYQDERYGNRNIESAEFIPVENIIKTEKNDIDDNGIQKEELIQQKINNNKKEKVIIKQELNIDNDNDYTTFEELQNNNSNSNISSSKSSTNTVVKVQNKNSVKRKSDTHTQNNMTNNDDDRNNYDSNNISFEQNTNFEKIISIRDQNKKTEVKEDPEVEIVRCKYSFYEYMIYYLY